MPNIFSSNCTGSPQIRIKYKIACLRYQIITGTAPQYLAELVQIFVPSQSLHSSLDYRTFNIPTFKRKHYGGHAFASWLQKSVFISLRFLSITAFPSPPSKLALKLTSSNSIWTSNSFSATQILNSVTTLLALWTILGLLGSGQTCHPSPVYLSTIVGLLGSGQTCHPSPVYLSTIVGLLRSGQTCHPSPVYLSTIIGLLGSEQTCHPSPVYLSTPL